MLWLYLFGSGYVLPLLLSPRGNTPTRMITVLGFFFFNRLTILLILQIAFNFAGLAQ